MLHGLYSVAFVPPALPHLASPLGAHPLDDDTLLASTGAWRDHARFVGAHYTPGLRNVWMGRPLRASQAIRNGQVGSGED